MNSAEELRKSINIYLSRDDLTVPEIIENIMQGVESYANHRIKQLLDVSDEEIEKIIKSKVPKASPENKALRYLGAKMLRNHLLNKEI